MNVKINNLSGTPAEEAQGEPSKLSDGNASCDRAVSPLKACGDRLTARSESLLGSPCASSAGVPDKLFIYKSLFWQVCRFGIVGLTAAAIHFSIVVCLVRADWLAPLVANIVGFMVSFQVSYWGHRLWTFNDNMTLHRVAFLKLLLVQIVNFTANESLFYFFLLFNFPYEVALLMVLTILPIFTFVSSKLWVFKPDISS